jgi:hypothetical protein
VKLFFLAILFLGVIAVIGCSQPAGVSQPSTAAEALSPAISPLSNAVVPASSRLDFVYFHPKKRCALCMNLEMLTRLFLEDNYKDALTNGKITFTSYELEDQKNAALVKEYGALSSQLFIDIVVDGKENIKQIEKIWLPEIYNDGQAFETYMKSIVSKGLEAIQ